ncbi:hypothetical protein VTN96DRAFT_1002 [Rasamsonia emersonii]
MMLDNDTITIALPGMWGRFIPVADLGLKISSSHIVLLQKCFVKRSSQDARERNGVNAKKPGPAPRKEEARVWPISIDAKDNTEENF